MKYGLWPEINHRILDGHTDFRLHGFFGLPTARNLWRKSFMKYGLWPEINHRILDGHTDFRLHGFFGLPTARNLWRKSCFRSCFARNIVCSQIIFLTKSLTKILTRMRSSSSLLGRILFWIALRLEILMKIFRIIFN